MIDAATLTQIWNQHASRLLLVARSIAGPGRTPLAEDAVQEAYVILAVQDKLPNDPLAWLVCVVRNQILQSIRSGVRRDLRESILTNKPWFEPDLHEKLDAEDVTTAMMKLSSPGREIIVMHLWGEMSFDSIGEVLEISRATAHRRYTAGMQILRQQFSGDRDPQSMRACNE
ncbi:RNA polymerase sigma factor [Rubripirellula reticaptiva]|uniref:RNA polymerase sigma factor n=1 Tax=Rubripirellula reticaptiva TaxID=2528013 RepID=A0A5C6EEN1_9BACT|nr:sigma-70 family RNA polymerase sigma factor [Rubripirellula reticaptiva]TWU47120.1 RNA polymerase sigma factor [Rubripirellula reticaptiva]